MTATVFAPMVNALRRLIEHYDIDPGPIFAGHNLSPDLLKDPDARIPVQKLLDIWDALFQRVNDPCIGLQLAQVVHPSHIGSMGYAWLASTSLRTAFERAIRFQSFVNEDIKLSIEEADGFFTVVRTDSEASSSEAFWYPDAGLALILWLCRLNAGPEFTPVSVDLGHQKPGCSGEYYAYYRCKVNFNAGRYALTFRVEDIDHELDSANPHLAQLNDQIMVKAIARLKSSSLADRTRAAIIEELPSAGVTDSLIAEKLHMSARTLQRRLNKEGTTFRTLMTQIRQELAQTYIRDSTLTLKEISFQLGYSDSSAFSSAYRRWTGHSPSSERVNRG